MQFLGFDVLGVLFSWLIGWLLFCFIFCFLVCGKVFFCLLGGDFVCLNRKARH